MKHYKFKMKDKSDGNIFEGTVSGEDWRDAWIKLSPLRAGHTILDIKDAEEDDEEPSNMSILQLVESPESEESEELEEPEDLFHISFMLLSGEPINVCAKAGLVDLVNQWFSTDDEDTPPVISLMVDDSIISLDKMFVGAIVVTPLSFDDLDEYEDTLEKEEGDGHGISTESTSNSAEAPDGSL